MHTTSKSAQTSKSKMVFGSFFGDSVESKLARAVAVPSGTAFNVPPIPFAIVHGDVAFDDDASQVSDKFGKEFRQHFHIDTDNWVFINHGESTSYPANKSACLELDPN
jgi:hypothetical protein